MQMKKLLYIIPLLAAIPMGVSAQETEEKSLFYEVFEGRGPAINRFSWEVPLKR